MIKDELSLVICNTSNNKQIILELASLLNGEAKFKKFFKVLTSRNNQQHQTHVCIRCNMLSNQLLSNIKFNSPDSNLLVWLKKECICLESDSLGVDKLVTVGCFVKIAPELTHLANFHDHLANQLMMIDINTNTAVKLAP